MKEKLLTILYKTRSAFDHYIFFMAEFLLAAIVLITGTEVTGAIIFLLLICIKLFICDDILSIINPILMASVFLTNCYDSYDTFIQYVYLVIPAAAALIFHLVVYRKKIVVGKSLYGILAVAFAILVGGLGKVPFEKYLIGSNLYYYLGLSIGMVLIYLFMKSRLATERKYDLNEKFAVIMTLWGLLTVFNIAFYYYGYLRDPSDINITQYLSANYLSRNNLSTYIMFALPFPLLLSKKYPAVASLSVVFYIAMILTGSRGGFIMGSIEFLFCIAYWIADGKRRILKASIIAVIAVIAVFALKDVLMEIMEWRAVGDNLISEDEARFKMFKALTERFKDQWFLGEGLLSDINAPYYTPKSGAMYWYHMMIPQIVGSMGIVGVLAYGYQFVGRVRLIFKKINRTAMCLGISYLGILLMSQVNPGEFCPLPYELLVVVIFILLEENIKKAEETKSGEVSKIPAENAEPNKTE